MNIKYNAMIKCKSLNTFFDDENNEYEDNKEEE